MVQWSDAEFAGVQAMRSDKGYEIQRPILHIKRSLTWVAQEKVDGEEVEGRIVFDFRKGLEGGKYLPAPYPPEARRGYVAIVASSHLVQMLHTARLRSTIAWLLDPTTHLFEAKPTHRIAYVPIETASDWTESLPHRLTQWAAAVAQHMIRSGREDRAAWTHAEQVLYAAWDMLDTEDMKTADARHTIAILLGITVCETEGIYETAKLRTVTRRAVETERLVPTLPAFFAEMLRANEALRTGE